MISPTQMDTSANTGVVEAPVAIQSKEVPPSVLSSVKLWSDRVRAARTHWEPDFKRMRMNMEFVAGYQWHAQKEMDDDRYIANLTLRLVNQKVASLYARNPRFVPKRRKRMWFQIWDERQESLQQAAAMMSAPPEEQIDPAHRMAGAALIADYTQGNQMRALVDRVGVTLEHVFSWQLDNQAPSFKVQMKQLVRQVSTTGIGYVGLDFARAIDNPLSSTASDTTIGDRMKAAELIKQKYLAGEIDTESPEMVELAMLTETLSAYQSEQSDIQERLVFDFLPSTSVIIDPRCRALKGFVGARWIAVEYIMPLDEINAHFKTNINVGVNSDIKQYNDCGEEVMTSNVDYAGEAKDKRPFGCLWKIYDLATKSYFCIVDGYKDFVQQPEAVFPETKHFWPVFPLTFNDVCVEQGQKASIFPPSDVQLVKASQKEWNRSRQALREQRKANAPLYATGKGWLTQKDREAITDAVPNSVIELEGATPNTDINKLIIPVAHAPIDPAAYDTTPLSQDMFYAFGNENATQPASAENTATAATINEQSRVVTTTSNVDDLDDFLSALAEAGGEILLRECSPETVSRIAGPGAAWPTADREEYVQLLYLKIEAASAGRPNKALELSNFQQIAPLLLQAGANPQFIVREALKRLDDNMDMDEAFSLGPTQAMPMQPQAMQQQTPAQPPRGNKTPSQGNQLPSSTVPNARPQGAQVG